MKRWNRLSLTSFTILLKLLPLAVARGGNDATPDADTNVGSTDVDLRSYFRLKEHSNVISAHIALMVIAWAFLLPIAVMLSTACSRFHVPAQLAFSTANAFGILLGVIYKRQTPTLYEKEKHSPIGWFSTFVASAWAVGSLITAYDSRKRGRRPQHQRFNDEQPNYDPNYIENDVEDIESRSLLRRTTVDRFLSQKISRFSSSTRILQAISTMNTVFGRMMLLFGFLCITTGVVVYGGIFQGKNVFNGLAHFIKGGIFFWYGLLTFGRWTGCFADLGWAWNRKPPKEIVGRWRAMIPSAEFIESAVICLYGASNVWLEHLSNPGGEWAANDLEHVSITLLFFGGGLLGMLVESKTIRGLLMTTIDLLRDERLQATSVPIMDCKSRETEQWHCSTNPMPALTIYLLGSMMGAHHQTSMVSTMLHAQWGKLFTGSSLARIATYAILYLKPPVTYRPQRPPTEVIASFCLVSGGIMLMTSNKDTVKALEYNLLDAMFLFNVTMGFTAFLMAWAAVCLAVKGWAQRSEATRVVGSKT